MEDDLQAVKYEREQLMRLCSKLEAENKKLKDEACAQCGWIATQNQIMREALKKIAEGMCAGYCVKGKGHCSYPEEIAKAALAGRGE